MKRSEVGIGFNCDVMIFFTPQVALTYQIWGQLGPYNSIRAQPYALEKVY